jgi:general secretion pathway protein K
LRIVGRHDPHPCPHEGSPSPLLPFPPEGEDKRRGGIIFGEGKRERWLFQRGLRIETPIHGERGVALLIALLVTTLLMALIVEFTYATRVSLRAAVNFRDSQRAYYLARSGVNVAGKLLAEYLKQGKLQDMLVQREPPPLPFVSEGDTVLNVTWEDEAGKIGIANVGTGQPSLARLEKLFGIKGISLEVLDRIKEKRSFRLIGELHQVMSDEEFGKIQDAVSVYAPSQVDINTASADVLQSLGLSSSVVSLIIEKRGREPFDTRDKINAFPGMDTNTAGMLDVTSNVFTVHSSATVGDYTKLAEAVIVRNAGGFTVLYWKIL